MAYAVRRRRFPPGLAGENPFTLGFEWGSFFTDIGKSAAQGAASAGVASLQRLAMPKPQAPPPAPAAAALTSTAGGIPVWGWAIGGLGLVLILVMAMGRR